MTLTAVSGFVTIVTIPPLVRVATQVFATDGELLHLPILDTMMQIFVVMAIPVLLGMWIRARSDTWARRLERLVKGFAILLLVLIVVVPSRGRLGTWRDS